MDDQQFALSGVVGDDDGGLKEVVVRMTRAAEEDAAMRQVLADLAFKRGGLFAVAFKAIDPEKVRMKADEKAVAVRS